MSLTSRFFSGVESQLCRRSRTRRKSWTLWITMVRSWPRGGSNDCCLRVKQANTCRLPSILHGFFRFQAELPNLQECTPSSICLTGHVWRRRRVSVQLSCAICILMHCHILSCIVSTRTWSFPPQKFIIDRGEVLWTHSLSWSRWNEPVIGKVVEPCATEVRSCRRCGWERNQEGLQAPALTCDIKPLWVDMWNKAAAMKPPWVGGERNRRTQAVWAEKKLREFELQLKLREYELRYAKDECTKTNVSCVGGLLLPRENGAHLLVRIRRLMPIVMSLAYTAHPFGYIYLYTCRYQDTWHQ